MHNEVVFYIHFLLDQTGQSTRTYVWIYKLYGRIEAERKLRICFLFYDEWTMRLTVSHDYDECHIYSSRWRRFVRVVLCSGWFYIQWFVCRSCKTDVKFTLTLLLTLVLSVACFFMCLYLNWLMAASVYIVKFCGRRQGHNYYILRFRISNMTQGRKLGLFPNVLYDIASYRWFSGSIYDTRIEGPGINKLFN